MLKAEFHKYSLHFTFLARTSRSQMLEKETYFVKVWDPSAPEVAGYGECNLFKGLSHDDTPDYEQLLAAACESGLQQLPACSSIIFGAETALSDLENGGRMLPFGESDFSRGERGLPINGLVWMGDRDLMLQRIREKIGAGFRCLKLKIGGIDFNDELGLLAAIRRKFSEAELEIRLDANGAFSPAEAMGKLDALSQYGIHTIEQPIKAGLPQQMREVCINSPIPIALDEELIGLRSRTEKETLLAAISPRYIILKPALCGGLAQADEWIEVAENQGIGWWATSALESNIGLNAIGQWVARKAIAMPQGLGTGQLYSNNLPSPLRMVGAALWHDPNAKWGLANIDFQ